VTVLALDAQPFHVVLVAERNRLVGPLSLPGNPRGTLQLVQRDAERDNDQARQYKACAGQRVRTAVKNLRHECVPVSS